MIQQQSRQNRALIRARFQHSAFDGRTYNIALNDNITYFTEQDMNLDNRYYSISELDELGRCEPGMGKRPDQFVMNRWPKPAMLFLHFGMANLKVQDPC